MDRMEQFESVCSENEEKSLKDYSSECAIEWLRGGQGCDSDVSERNSGVQPD